MCSTCRTELEPWARIMGTRVRRVLEHVYVVCLHKPVRFQGLDWLEIQWRGPWQRRSLSKGEASRVQNHKRRFRLKGLAIEGFRQQAEDYRCRKLRAVHRMIGSQRPSPTQQRKLGAQSPNQETVPEGFVRICFAAYEAGEDFSMAFLFVSICRF